MAQQPKSAIFRDVVLSGSSAPCPKGEISRLPNDTNPIRYGWGNYGRNAVGTNVMDQH
jgi:hypothetical protein